MAARKVRVHGYTRKGKHVSGYTRKANPRKSRSAHRRRTR